MTVLRKAWEHRDEALDPALGIREGSKKGGEVCFKNEERIYPKAQRCKYAIYMDFKSFLSQCLILVQTL